MSSPVATDVRSLPELLEARARSKPDQVAFVHLADGRTESAQLSYGELHASAQAIGQLLAAVARPGDRAVLAYDSGLEFVSAFFGCLHAGVIAVPAPLAASSRKSGYGDRLTSIVHDSGANMVLTTTRHRDTVLRRLAPAEGLPALEVLTTNDLPVGAESSPYPAQPETIAYLQYSSGSTGPPKGVILTHGAVLANLKTIAAACPVPDGSGLVSWLPHFHDMGLVSSVLQPLFSDAPAFTMPARTVVQRPLMWLEAIERYRAAVSVAPNFGYEMCLQRVRDDQARTLDLSSWEIALCGAEPVQAEVLERFAGRFAPSGFRKSAFLPCYGLAEATLMVTAGPDRAGMVAGNFNAAQLARNRLEPAMGPGRRLVASGAVLGDPHILIADPETLAPLEEGHVGEICIAGQSVCSGYWGNPAETLRAFDPRLPKASGDRFLRTGDVGAIHEGQLYVTGRLHDLITVDGQNFYPHELERTAGASHPAIIAQSCAAFSIQQGGRQEVVVVAEVSRGSANRLDGVSAEDPTWPVPPPAVEIVEAVRQSIAAEHGLHVHDVRLVHRFAIPLTSSGKIQRVACREQYLAGVYDPNPARDPRRLAGVGSNPEGKLS
jgi:acyl-CoA synthetase (AMP-forming)/AMP-acid ligase II